QGPPPPRGRDCDNPRPTTPGPPPAGPALLRITRAIDTETETLYHHQDNGHPNATPAPTRHRLPPTRTRLHHRRTRRPTHPQHRNRNSKGLRPTGLQRARHRVSLNDGRLLGKAAYGTSGSRGSSRRETPSAMGHVSSVLDNPLTLTSI